MKFEGRYDRCLHARNRRDHGEMHVWQCSGHHSDVLGNTEQDAVNVFSGETTDRDPGGVPEGAESAAGKDSTVEVAEEGAADEHREGKMGATVGSALCDREWGVHSSTRRGAAPNAPGGKSQDLSFTVLSSQHSPDVPYLFGPVTKRDFRGSPWW